MKVVLFVIILCAALGFSSPSLLKNNDGDDTMDVHPISGIFIDAPAPDF